MSNYVVVITGASSGFGALSARAISKAGHIVYAGMRWTTGANAKEVEMEPAGSYVADVTRAIAKVVDTPFGKRPFE